jgi:hypothetical protein
MQKPNVIIRMSAATWEAQVRKPDGDLVRFDFREMDKRQRATWHREFMNAFRQTQQAN